MPSFSEVMVELIPRVGVRAIDVLIGEGVFVFALLFGDFDLIFCLPLAEAIVRRTVIPDDCRGFCVLKRARLTLRWSEMLYHSFLTGIVMCAAGGTLQ